MRLELEKLYLGQLCDISRWEHPNPQVVKCLRRADIYRYEVRLQRNVLKQDTVKCGHRGQIGGVIRTGQCLDNKQPKADSDAKLGRQVIEAKLCLRLELTNDPSSKIGT